MGLLARLYRWFEYPHRLLAVRKAIAATGAAILDVGCGNHSPSITKRHFPRCVYHGVDRAAWNLDQRDAAAMDVLYRVDLSEPAGLDQIDAARYDAVVASHVLEHLDDPYAVAERLAEKVRPGGLFYVEVPAPASDRFPRARDGWLGIKGCLNFHDDPTHRAMVELPRIAALLEHKGFAVGPVRRRFLWRRLVLLPAYVLAGIVLRGYVPASVVWDVVGFAQCLVAQRRKEKDCPDFRVSENGTLPLKQGRKEALHDSGTRRAG
jgi:SAM-dependent methyltransferase